MMRALIRKDQHIRTTTDLCDIATIKDDPDAAVWVDVCNASHELMRDLQQIFGFHDLAVADCLDDINNKPRISDHGNHCFIILQSVQKTDDADLHVGELDVFIGNRFLVTVHKLPLDILDRVWEDASQHDRLLSRGPDFVLYSLVSCLTDVYFDMLEVLDDEVDGLEDSIIAHPSQEVINDIFHLKRQLIHLRRIAGPQREVFALLNHREFPFVTRETMVYFRDVYEHLIRIYEMIDSLRDLLSGTFDAYLSTVSNRMNEVMKSLTLVATFFMPLTLISSIYGMNFQYMPELSWRYGYFACLALMGCLAVGMIVYFRRKGWL